MTTVILFVFGTIIGSFLNVVGLRFNSGLSLGGRSACVHCGEKLRFWELVPVLSFLFLRGRCRHCYGKISWQYPLIEVWTGLLFVTVPYIFIPTFSLYVLITIYDLRHKIIPDSLVYASIVLALFTSLLSPYTLVDWLAGPILFSFFALLWLVSRGRAIGFGDAKLALSVGLLLGAPLGFSGVIVSFWLGAIYGLFLVFKAKFYPLLRGSKKITMKSELPFAPFLIIGAWLSIILKLDLLHVSSLF